MPHSCHFTDMMAVNAPQRLITSLCRKCDRGKSMKEWKQLMAVSRKMEAQSWQ
ncbi:MAG: hypothetical protein V7K27_23420 [Nostoc sp.]|uniref:hypothetical protein n=1 Tax=Nostoc sp. TaxID=1180 RepID=UPI002FF80BC1